MARRNIVDILIRARDEASKKLNKVDKEGGKLDKTFKKLGASLAGFFSVAAISAGTVKAIKSSSDLRESVNAVNVVFAEGAETVLKFGENSARATGLATADFNQLSAVTGALLKDSGLAMDVVAQKTNLIAVRAADMASVMNTTVQDALSAMNQALRGETEAIRRYTGDVTNAAMQHFLLSKGITDSVEKMSEQEKRLVRLELMFSQTDKFAGDFANTNEELANQQRIAAANTENLAAKIGTKLLPIVTEATSVYNKFLESLMSTELERAVDKLEKIGGDTELIKRLRTQVEINKLLGDQANIEKEITDFAIEQTKQREVVGTEWLVLQRVEFTEINKLARQSTEELIKQVKETKDISALQTEIQDLAKERIALQTEIVEEINKGTKEEDETLIALRLQERSLQRIFEGATKYVALIAQKEIAEKTVESLMKSQADSQDRTTKGAEKELEIRNELWQMTSDANRSNLDSQELMIAERERINAILIDERTEWEKKLDLYKLANFEEEKEFELRNDIKDLTAEQILAENKAFVILNEFGPALARAVVQGENLKEVLEGILRQLASRALLGLIGAGIGSFLGPGGAAAGFNIGFGAPVFKAQHGDSGTFPGQGSQERPYWGMATPGEDFNITPKGSSSKVVNVFSDSDRVIMSRAAFRSFMREFGAEVMFEDMEMGKY